jgi:hypothetical protein
MNEGYIDIRLSPVPRPHPPADGQLSGDDPVTATDRWSVA